MTSPYLTTEEAAAYLRMHPEVLKRHARAKTVRGWKLGKDWRFKTEWLDKAGL